MKRLTDSTLSLVNELWSPVGAIRRLLRDEHHPAQLIKQIAEQDEPGAIAPLLPFLKGQRATIEIATSAALHHLVCLVPPEDLLDLECEIRWKSEWAISDWWHKLKPREVVTLPKTDDSYASIFGLVSFHPSGYVREEAVRQLAALKSGTEVPFLLLRVNDWVSHVRDVAQRAVQDRLDHGAIDPFSTNMILVLRLLECGRDDHRQFVDNVVELLTTAEHRRVMIGLLSADNRDVRRPMCSLALARSGGHVADVLRVGLHSPDPVIRLWAIRLAASIFAGQELENVLARMAGDHFMPVRREVLLTRMKIHPESAITSMREALFDRSYSMRDVSRFHLKRLGHEDFATHYRQAMREGRHLPVAIDGIRETGGSEDFALVRPFLESPLSKFRRAAVAFVGQHVGDEAVEILLKCLDDKSSKVCKTAKTALANRVNSINVERVWSIFKRADHLHVNLTCIELLGEFDMWLAIPFLIQATCEPDETIADRAEQQIMRRYNRVFTKPPPEVAARVSTSLEQWNRPLSPSLEATRQWLRGLLNQN